MTYQNDPNRGMRNDNSWIGWVVGGLLAVAVIIGIFSMFGRSDQSNTATSNSPAQSTAPSTTGTGTSGRPASTPSAPNTQPAPAPR